MATYDIKKDRKDLYAPKAGQFQAVDVPRLNFLMIDGHGDPNVEPAYAHAVQALYTASYAVRFWAKREWGTVHTVGPLEGLWWAADPADFVRRNKAAWEWTMMIVQPDWISADVVVAALAEASRTKDLPSVNHLRFEPYDEGRSVQTLHVGSYDDEGPTLAYLHDEYLPQHDLAMNGHHHEIYLSDARRTAPSRLRTILRQPVS